MGGTNICDYKNFVECKGINNIDVKRLWGSTLMLLEKPSDLPISGQFINLLRKRKIVELEIQNLLQQILLLPKEDLRENHKIQSFILHLNKFFLRDKPMESLYKEKKHYELQINHLETKIQYLTYQLDHEPEVDTLTRNKQLHQYQQEKRQLEKKLSMITNKVQQHEEKKRKEEYKKQQKQVQQLQEKQEKERRKKQEEERKKRIEEIQQQEKQRKQEREPPEVPTLEHPFIKKKSLPPLSPPPSPPPLSLEPIPEESNKESTQKETFVESPPSTLKPKEEPKQQSILNLHIPVENYSGGGKYVKEGLNYDIYNLLFISKHIRYLFIKEKQKEKQKDILTMNISFQENDFNTFDENDNYIETSSKYDNYIRKYIKAYIDFVFHTKDVIILFPSQYESPFVTNINIRNITNKKTYLPNINQLAYIVNTYGRKIQGYDLYINIEYIGILYTKFTKGNNNKVEEQTVFENFDFKMNDSLSVYSICHEIYKTIMEHILGTSKTVDIYTYKEFSSLFKHIMKYVENIIKKIESKESFQSNENKDSSLLNKMDFDFGVDQKQKNKIMEDVKRILKKRLTKLVETITSSLQNYINEPSTIYVYGSLCQSAFIKNLFASTNKTTKDKIEEIMPLFQYKDYVKYIDTIVNKFHEIKFVYNKNVEEG